MVIADDARRVEVIACGVVAGVEVQHPAHYISRLIHQRTLTPSLPPTRQWHLRPTCRPARPLLSSTQSPLTRLTHRQNRPTPPAAARPRRTAAPRSRWATATSATRPHPSAASTSRARGPGTMPRTPRRVPTLPRRATCTSAATGSRKRQWVTGSPPGSGGPSTTRRRRWACSSARVPSPPARTMSRRT
jgi:hypothetical protein